MELKMDKILLILVVVSLLIAAVQAVQLISTKNSLNEGGFSLGSASTSLPVGSSSGGQSSSIIDIQAEIPDQVGGCF